MARVPIHRVGGAVDTTDLTTGPGDVLTPEIFIGSGSDENQQGTIPLRGSPALTLPVNGSQTLQAGYYAGGTVSQSIPTMGAQSIGPGAQMITIPTAGKFMTGNITIKTTKNLIPSVIKKGVTVGGVTGTFEGYVITDPKTLYKYGTFNGIQSVTALKYNLNDYNGTVSFERDSIKAVSSTSYRSVVLVFNTPINFDNLNTLMIRYQSQKYDYYGGNGISFSIWRNHVTNYMWDDNTSSNRFPNPALGEELLYGGEIATGGDYTKSVASVTGNAYLYIVFETGSISNLRIVAFE